MEIPFHRLFSMPAFEGLRVIRGYIIKKPECQICEIIQLIKNIEADANSFDLEASEYLHSIVDNNADLAGAGYYRCCVRDIVLHRLPVWAKLMTLGRTRFAQKLARDEQSMFRQAGLLHYPPSDDVIQWWDELTGRVRLVQDIAKLEQARAAEKLTLDYERKRLQALGISAEPVWTAIEDNTAGYDVQSYEKNAYGLVNKLIEVKSTVASPLRFYVTRNEWEHAVLFGDAYHFHIWDMKKKPPTLYARTMANVAPHIPKDSAKGKWKNAEIPINIV